MIWAWFFLFLSIWFYMKLSNGLVWLWDSLPLPMLYLESFLRLTFWLAVLAVVLSYFGHDGLLIAELGLFS